MAKSRVFAVFESGKAVALVRAGNAAKAVAHFNKDRFEAHAADAADADEMFTLARQGMEIAEADDVQQPALL